MIREDQKMRRARRFILIALGSLLLLCVSCGLGIIVVIQMARQAANDTFIVDSTRADSVGASVADYDIPDGYHASAVNVLGLFKGVALAKDQKSALIMLVQIPPNVGLTREQIQSQIEEATWGSGTGDQTKTEIIDRPTVMIRGQAVTLIVRESTNSETGSKARYVDGFFTGKNGTVMLMTWGYAEDQELIDTFISSIR